MSIDRASGFAPASAGGRSGGRLGFGGLVGFSVGGRSAGRLGLGGFVRSGRGGPSYSGLWLVVLPPLFCRRPLCRPIGFGGDWPGVASFVRAALRRLVRDGVLERACRGVYVYVLAGDAEPRLIEQIAVALRRGYYSYTSLESALSEYGAISQIPVDRLTVMTTGRKGVFAPGGAQSNSPIPSGRRPIFWTTLAMSAGPCAWQRRRRPGATSSGSAAIHIWLTSRS